MKRLFTVLGLLVIASMVLAACAPAATPTAGPTAAPTEEEPTEAPTSAPTEAPTAEPTMPPTTRKGGWADQLSFSSVSAESAVAQIEADAIDIYSRALASDKLEEIENSSACYIAGNSGYYDILYNPAVYNDGRFNPFTNRKIREATNWLLDRNFINQEIYFGGSIPKWHAITTQLVDYTNVIDTARSVEAFYAYNPDKANEVIAAEMEGMGATLGSDGKWQFDGAPVTLIFLIRNDGDGTRLQIGDYFATQLEGAGFTVTRQYGRSSELSPLWIGSDPKEGLWDIYTAGWLPSGLDRDEASSFQEMYLNSSAQGIPLFLENVSDPEFQQVGDDLANGNFATIEERTELMSRALELAPQDSLQVWIIDQLSYTPFDCGLTVAYDVAAGVEPAYMSWQGMRWADSEGGTIRIGTNEVFTDPWNPVNGSNWVWDGAVQNTTAQLGFMPDPYTGLYWPWRAETAAVTAQTGLPVAKNLDWITLDTADSIAIPDDAWVDWDAANQVFITRAEQKAALEAAGATPEEIAAGDTAKTKTVVTYPADLFETVKWHDGSNMSVGDFIMRWIMIFDQSKEESAIYDASTVPNFESFMSHFKGIKIISTDPFVYEFYDDNAYLDAELLASQADYWPEYGFGEAGWPAIAMGNAAEANGELAYSTDKATELEVEWTSFVGGPSLDILSANLDALAAGTEEAPGPVVPYAPTLGTYITAEEAAARYAALQAWYAEHGRFWVGTGPYWLQTVDVNADIATVASNPDYADLSDRWAAFGEPKLGDAVVEGPAQVTIGSEAVFDFTVTTKAGDPYPAADVKQVKFLVYNEAGETVYVGEGVATGDGTYTLTIPADVTSQLAEGTGRIEAGAVLIPVAIPAFSSADYVVIP
jgi:peptide/nickel transport system substrate-binding protein